MLTFVVDHRENPEDDDHAHVARQRNSSGLEPERPLPMPASNAQHAQLSGANLLHEAFCGNVDELTTGQQVARAAVSPAKSATVRENGPELVIRSLGDDLESDHVQTAAEHDQRNAERGAGRGACSTRAK